MSEILKSRHAFGSQADIATAIEKGVVDAYDVLFLKEGKIGWLDGNGELIMLQEQPKEILFVEELPEQGEEKIAYVFGGKFYFWNGKEFVPSATDCGVTEVLVDEKIATAKEEATNSAVNTANAYTDKQSEIVEKIKFEITSKPVGTLVNYSEKEIRVMCPENTVWVKQNVGSTGNANMYYMGFKAYAPENAYSFKEGDRGVIVDEMLYFENNDFAGVDEYGRKYSIVWLALANYDESTDTWTYYGSLSSAEKYIGWDYVVDWYDADGIKIASDSIRINLSNENCHTTKEPYYANSIVKSANAYTDEKIAEAIAVIEF